MDRVATDARIDIGKSGACSNAIRRRSVIVLPFMRARQIFKAQILALALDDFETSKIQAKCYSRGPNLMPKKRLPTFFSYSYARIWRAAPFCRAHASTVLWPVSMKRRHLYAMHMGNPGKEVADMQDKYVQDRALLRIHVFACVDLNMGGSCTLSE